MKEAHEYTFFLILYLLQINNINVILAGYSAIKINTGIEIWICKINCMYNKMADSWLQCLTILYISLNIDHT